MKSSRVETVIEKLGERSICWFGGRASDAEPLLETGRLGVIYCLIGAEEGRTEVHSLELHKDERMDLNDYDVNDDPSEKARKYMDGFLDKVRSPILIVPYRPTLFIHTAQYCKPDLITYAGTFYLAQKAFEHKPWVEQELRRCGVPTIDWHYVKAFDVIELIDRLGWDKVVVRASFSDGGNGFYVAKSQSSLINMQNWKPAKNERFLSYSKFYEKSIPINVNAVVCCNDETIVYPPSVQLIGIRNCTNRDFGFCGSDFALALRLLDANRLGSIFEITKTTGHLLFTHGYLGAFGVDFLLTSEGEILFTEINPRFQSSTPLASNIAKASQQTDPYIEHLAAHMGIPAERQEVADFLEHSTQHEDISQIVCYNSSGVSRRRNPAWVPESNDLLSPKYLPRPGIGVNPEGMIFKAFVKGSVSSDGRSLNDDYAIEVERLALRILSSR